MVVVDSYIEPQTLNLAELELLARSLLAGLR